LKTLPIPFPKTILTDPNTIILIKWTTMVISKAPNWQA